MKKIFTNVIIKNEKDLKKVTGGVQGIPMGKPIRVNAQGIPMGKPIR